jgi:NAD-dependent histone deacetylase SIR2
MREAIDSKTVPRCVDTTCNGLVKPKIVFFGEQLPAEFFDNRDLLPEADLCIVLGTSLSVQPFASLPQFVNDSVPRLLVNMEQVGDLGSRPDDVLILKDCDTGVKELAEACGWLDELEALWAKTAKEDQFVPEKKEEVKKSRDELLQDEVDKLTRDVEKTLQLGSKQQEWLDNHVDKKIAQKQDGEDESSNLRPTDDADSKILAPAAGTSASGGGLAHIFPFLSGDKKSGSSNL